MFNTQRDYELSNDLELLNGANKVEIEDDRTISEYESQYHHEQLEEQFSGSFGMDLSFISHNMKPHETES